MCEEKGVAGRVRSPGSHSARTLGTCPKQRGVEPKAGPKHGRNAPLALVPAPGAAGQSHSGTGWRSLSLAVSRRNT
eukprot:3645701-Prymnesium_polylepis.1